MVLSSGQVHLLIDSINKAIVDFNKSVSLNPNFPVAFAQKLFTDYRKLFKPKSNKNVYYFSFQIFKGLNTWLFRAASMIGDSVKVVRKHC